MSSLFLVPDSVPLLRFPFSESSQSPSRSGRFFSFGIFRAALLFICQGACVFPGRNSITLSQERSVVKTFFVFIKHFCRCIAGIKMILYCKIFCITCNEIYYTIQLFSCQHYFSKNCIFFQNISICTKKAHKMGFFYTCLSLSFLFNALIQ